MVRTRIPEASLVGLLAALATFCALEARGGQPYSIVGQSSPATAATGRRPLAERIKAANRPIRIAAEEELAPDQGLIPGLDDPNTVEREWIPGPAVVEFPTGGPDAIAVDEVVVPEEPGVMPPPDSTATAAHPTTGDDAGLVGEASTIETEGPVASADEDGSASQSTERVSPATEESAAIPDRLPEGTGTAARAQAARVTPPRRTAARVTPKRREALLERLRTALAEVPRPLGLIPASPSHQAGVRRPQSAPRSAVARHPVPAASLPQPLTALPANTPTDAELPADSLVAVDSLADDSSPGDAMAGDDPDGVPLLADGDTTTEPTAAHDAASDLATEPTPTAADALDSLVESAAPGPEADATGAVPGLPDGEPEAIAEVAASADSIAASDASPETTDTAAVPAADLSATPALQQPRATSQPQARRQSGSKRPLASRSQQQPMTPLDRLQARLEQMPRALGLVPAPRPSMHAAQAPRRRTAAPAPAAKLEAVTTAPAAPTDPAPAADDVVATDGPSETSEAPATVEGDVAHGAPELAAPVLESLETDGSLGDAGSPPPADTTSDESTESTLATDDGVEPDHLAVADGEAEATTPASETESDEVVSDAVGASASLEAPALVTTATEESAMPAPGAEPKPAAKRHGAAPAKRPAPRHQASQPAAPVARRPIRDALGTALANVPRPFGLLPEPESIPQRRPAANPAIGTPAPRALATKSIGTRPLDGTAEAQADVARATVATPPEATPTEVDGTTLTSGSDAQETRTPAALADGAGEPAVLDAELREGAASPEALEASPASVEVTVTSPETSTALGERVTLLLTIRNPGATAVSSVTPVMHFGAGLEPLGIRGRNGHFSADGSVTFDRLAELPAGECVELEVIAVCTGAGTIPYRGVAWCGDGEDREIVPADASVTVTPAVATEPNVTRHR